MVHKEMFRCAVCGHYSHECPECSKRDYLRRIAVALEQLVVVSTRSPQKFAVTLTALDEHGDKVNMKASLAQLGFQILDNGVLLSDAVLTDASGNPPNPPFSFPDGTTYSWASSDPVNLPVSQNPANPLEGISNPQGLATGVVISLVASGTDANGNAFSFSGASAPVDVIAGPATGFVVTESAQS